MPPGVRRERAEVWMLCESAHASLWLERAALPICLRAHAVLPVMRSLLAALPMRWFGTMTALSGRELDRAIAEAKGEQPCGYETCNRCASYPPHYSTDWREAGPLLEEMREDGIWTVLLEADVDYTVNHAKFEGNVGNADTGPEAIARAYLAWRQAQGAEAP